SLFVGFNLLPSRFINFSPCFSVNSFCSFSHFLAFQRHFMVAAMAGLSARIQFVCIKQSHRQGIDFRNSDSSDQACDGRQERRQKVNRPMARMVTSLACAALVLLAL